MMIKYPMNMIKQARDLFPDATILHEMMRMGDPKAMDFVQMKMSFHIDEDDIIRAFRNKKEQKLLDMAKRAKSIRDMYQQMFMLIEKHQNRMAISGGYEDCV